tara:strand:- start:162 stop:287 length:126 start_codon:yes stop_codon:yes gene_type:complete
MVQAVCLERMAYLEPLILVVVSAGIEPATQAFSGLCKTFGA